MRNHVGALERHGHLVNAPRAHAQESLFTHLSPDTSDTRFDQFVSALGGEVYEDYEPDRRKWAGSPFENVRFAPPQSKGTKIGEGLGSMLFHHCDCPNVPAQVMEDDRVRQVRAFDLSVDNIGRVENKLCTERLDGTFGWSGLHEARYDQVLLLAVSPSELFGWMLPSGQFNELLQMKENGHEIRGLSRNADGSFGLAVNPNRVPLWMNPFGGRFSSLEERIRSVAFGN